MNAGGILRIKDMRMRRKPYARGELASVDFNIQTPPTHFGKWADVFKRKAPLMLELGCGKGGFISVLAAKNPDINYIAVDIKSEVLVVAKRNIERVFKEENREIDNVLIMAQDIERIDMMLSPKDQIERIYINFPNPWPKEKHKKRRLTYPRQLMKYRDFLKDGGEIRFKTDDDELFEESLEYFSDCGFKITYLTWDLHRENREDNIITEHEKMFSSEGIPIKMLIAEKQEMK